jgi:hypothetical protein
MTTKAADDFDSIARRLAELEAEKSVALTGTSVPVQEEKDETPSGYGDYLAWRGSLSSMAHPHWPLCRPSLSGESL